MNASQPSTYDQLPYTRYPFPNTHPDRLASIARVFGLTPPDVRSCRVLEIGCGRGGNLIPLAEQLPGSRLVGIDLSRIQIEEAQAWVSQLGFTNVTFLQMDIVDVEPSLGMFDYIVCHGVFSWVPDRVQQAILRICSEQLAPHGIAYISYNTKPGWNYRGSLRDAMLFHARPFQQPEEKLAEAKKLIDLLAKNLTGEEPHQKLLLNEIKSLEGKEDSYLVHEYLEETNSPCYFHEFANQLQSNGLQYVSEADLSLPFAKPETHSLSDAFESLSTSYLQLEQYSDFLSGRMFRQSLVCHEMQKVNRNCDPKVLLHFRLESLLEPCDPLPDPNPKPDSNPSENQVDLKHLYRSSYRSSYRYKHTGKVVQLDLERPLVECALRILAEVGNRGCSLAWLFAEAQRYAASLGLIPADDNPKRNLDGPKWNLNEELEVLQICLIRAFLSGGLWLHTTEEVHAISVSSKPKASLVARSLANTNERITTLQHWSVELNLLDRYLLSQLDGTHSIEHLLVLLGNAVAQRPELQPFRNADVRELLKSRLTHFVRLALLLK